MSLIKIEMLTEDPQMQELCKLYWLTDEEGKYVYKISDFIERFGVKTHEASKVVAQYCRAYRVDHVCDNCGKPRYFLKNRTDPLAHDTGQFWNPYQPGRKENLRDGHKLCKECKEKVEKQRKQEEQYQAEILKRQKGEKMQGAFENGTYESLNLLEFNFLVALSSSDNIEIARKKVGLSQKNSETLVEKFNELHLINYGVGIQGYAILQEFDEALQEIGLQRKVKSIFGSPKAFEVYRKLKKKYLFVFPEIPVCAFINREQVEHLFTENWHGMYFLTSRLDFVVCDPEGKPKFAIEYQGGYHKSPEQRKKDVFKMSLLNEVGLSVRHITFEDLKDEDII